MERGNGYKRTLNASSPAWHLHHHILLFYYNTLHHHLLFNLYTQHTSLIMDFIKKAASDFSSGNKGEQKPVAEGSNQQTATTDGQPAQNVQKDDYVDKGEFSLSPLMIAISDANDVCSLLRHCFQVWIQHRPKHPGEDHRRWP